jgi:RNA polymerase sigma-70 factor (ECF subfamily)
MKKHVKIFFGTIIAKFGIVIIKIKIMKENASLIEKTLQMDSHLRQYAVSLTMNLDDAEDLLQDTYLKVIQNENSYKEDTNLKAWVITIMKNTFINNYRRKQRSKVFIDQSEDLLYLSNSVSSNEDNADMHLYYTEINKKIQEKKEEQKKPFEMFIDGYKYQEIADEMNISIGTVKSRIFFMRKRLMEELNDYVSSARVS